MVTVGPFLSVLPLGDSLSGQMGIEDICIGTPDDYPFISKYGLDGKFKYELLLISVLAASGAGSWEDRSRMVTSLYPRFKRW